MSVSVVVPTAGVSDHLRRSVENMIESAVRAGPDAEVLVVVNGARSVPALRAVGSPLLRVIQLEQRNLSQARNIGIAQARHDTVIFGDDGAEIPTTWCADLADALRDERFPVVTAPVRVPVCGPVTAFLNYQRVFDAPPITATEALTVTGALGLRRDRLPATVRYDEQNLPQVGEDAALGLALRQAGIPIRWLGDVTPAKHLLPERVEEITERAYRYGGGAARVSCRRLGPVPSPDDVLTIYRTLVVHDHRAFRRFSEILDLGLRSAFTLFDFLFTASWLVGYLDEAGRELGRAIVDVDRDGLREALRQLATVTSAHVDDTGDPVTVDFRRLRGSDEADPLVAQARWLLGRYVTLRTPRAPRPDDQPAAVRPGEAGSATTDSTVDGNSSGRRRRGGDRPPRRADDRLPRLLEAWRRLRDSDVPIDVDAVELLGRQAGFGFRQACEAIERAA